jgi:hypothetical protein
MILILSKLYLELVLIYFSNSLWIYCFHQKKFLKLYFSTTFEYIYVFNSKLFVLELPPSRFNSGLLTEIWHTIFFMVLLSCIIFADHRELFFRGHSAVLTNFRDWVPTFSRSFLSGNITSTYHYLLHVNEMEI